MTQGDLESIKDFKRIGNLRKCCWFYYQFIIFVIETIRSKKESFYYKWFWFNKERLILFFSKSFSLIWVIWAVDREVNSCFNMQYVSYLLWPSALLFWSASWRKALGRWFKLNLLAKNSNSYFSYNKAWTAWK